VFHSDCAGTLSTVSLAGGAPRGLAEHVAYADWSPEGKDLLISTFSPAGARLEFPPGHELAGGAEATTITIVREMKARPARERAANALRSLHACADGVVIGQSN
jgi:hypothetical protein